MGRPKEFGKSTWAGLCFALVVAAGLSMGVHDLAIAHLGVPYPYHDAVPAWALFVDAVVRIGTLAFICRLGSWFLDRRSAAIAALMVGVTFAMLHEVIRVLIVNNAMVDGLVGRRWLFMAIEAVPPGLRALYMGAVALLVGRWLLIRADRGSRLLAAGAVLAAAAIFVAAGPLLHQAASGAQAALGLGRPPEVHHMPYGLYIYSFIYGTFLEPTLATFVLAFLVWPSLPRDTTKSVAAFAGLLLLARGRLVMFGLFSFWVPQPLPLAFAAESQFVLETLVMAVLVGMAWSWATRRAARQGLPEA